MKILSVKSKLFWLNITKINLLAKTATERQKTTYTLCDITLELHKSQYFCERTQLISIFI